MLLRRCGPVLLSVLLLAGPAWGATGPSARGARRNESVRWFEFGIEERVRNENFDNLLDQNRATDDLARRTRFRTRLWLDLKLAPGGALHAQLANESARTTAPETRFAWDETFFEQLYLDLDMGSNSVLRIGRQDLDLAKGFLFDDGTPLDDSRSSYFNAVTLTLPHGTSKFDLIALSDPHHDRFLPVFHDQHRPLIEWDENAAGFYLSQSAEKGAKVDVWYLYKTETGDTRAKDDPRRQPDRWFHTAGIRNERQLGGGWSSSGILAGQYGNQHPGRQIRTWIFTAGAERTLAGQRQTTLKFDYASLKGDDPASSRLEGWDPVFGRGPLWSEAYLYTLSNERGTGYWTNLVLYSAELHFLVGKSVTLHGSYSWLDAREAAGGDTLLFGTGRHRGDLWQARAEYQGKGNLQARVLGEWLMPGSFYRGSDMGWYFSAELTYTFRYKRMF